MLMTDYYLAIGSNLGNRQAHLDFAIEQLTEIDTSDVITVSPIYETEPISGDGIPDDLPSFLNGVVHIKSSLTPLILLNELQRIETEAGRPPKKDRAFWGSRTLDIDMLLVEDLVIDKGPELIIPHPRMCERWFVLKPLADIAPDLIHPTRNTTIRTLLAQLDHQPASRYSGGRQTDSSPDQQHD
ncbi:2-amino-4-hydroxy-6-hydroxymethyldihydropteridine diphosphokinase [Poriferisphaera corsica]|nr:2-amino-4-hydroxy-6-hydroxymethyldihydropteridine diphosphokinase [Poriferisphaera corsica]